MNEKRENQLIVIEKEKIKVYKLDNKTRWTIGRISGDNYPDIPLCLPTVSRQHGVFENADGYWFYRDLSSKNGTFLNDKKIISGIKGRKKTYMLNNGDILVFGGGSEAVISNRTAFTYFTERAFDDDWKKIYTLDYNSFEISDGDDITLLKNPDTGTVIKKDKGVAIYMGNAIYINGEISVNGY